MASSARRGFYKVTIDAFFPRVCLRRQSTWPLLHSCQSGHGLISGYKARLDLVLRTFPPRIVFHSERTASSHKRVWILSPANNQDRGWSLDCKILLKLTQRVSFIPPQRKQRLSTVITYISLHASSSAFSHTSVGCHTVRSRSVPVLCWCPYSSLRDLRFARPPRRLARESIGFRHEYLQTSNLSSYLLLCLVLMILPATCSYVRNHLIDLKYSSVDHKNEIEYRRRARNVFGWLVILLSSMIWIDGSILAKQLNDGHAGSMNTSIKPLYAQRQHWSQLYNTPCHLPTL